MFKSVLYLWNFPWDVFTFQFAVIGVDSIRELAPFPPPMVSWFFLVTSVLVFTILLSASLMAFPIVLLAPLLVFPLLLTALFLVLLIPFPQVNVSNCKGCECNKASKTIIDQGYWLRIIFSKRLKHSQPFFTKLRLDLGS